MVDTMESDPTAVTPHRPGWYGVLAGALAAAVALAFGELVSATNDDMPGLVLGMGEWVIDVAPGFVVAESIEELGSWGKRLLLPGITTTALLIAAALGRASLRISPRIGVVGFMAFGVLGGYTTARNPLSPALWSWILALLAAVVGAATLVFLLARLHRPTRLTTVLEDPRDPFATRRAFLAWSAGAGTLALTGELQGEVDPEDRDEPDDPHDRADDFEVVHLATSTALLSLIRAAKPASAPATSLRN